MRLYPSYIWSSILVRYIFFFKKKKQKRVKKNIFALPIFYWFKLQEKLWKNCGINIKYIWKKKRIIIFIYLINGLSSFTYDSSMRRSTITEIVKMYGELTSRTDIFLLHNERHKLSNDLAKSNTLGVILTRIQIGSLD